MSAMIRAPYNNAMRLGQGFNSFTQQICLNDAVGKGKRKPDESVAQRGSSGISQIVSYTSRFVDKISEVTNAMNISASLSIKTSVIGGKASGKYIDSDKFKESDLNFFIQVSVTNQEHMPQDYTEFNWISGLPLGRFTELYGDSFISGWEEGGEFNALLSVKVKDKSKTNQIAAELEASLGTPALSGEVKGAGELSSEDINSNTETTITVNWSGGGQIKETDRIWDIGSLTLAAANFPELVAMTPQRKYAILTKYTQLPSFVRQLGLWSPLDYENAGLYAGFLLEIYTEYKAIWASLQQLTWDVQNEVCKVYKASLTKEAEKYLTDFTENAKKTAKNDEDFETKRLVARSAEVDSSFETLTTAPAKDDGGDAKDLSITNGEVAEPKPSSNGATSIQTNESKAPLKKPFRAKIQSYAPYECTVIGLIDARADCRLEMIKVVNEVDLVTGDPSIAADPDRKQTFLNPSVFKQLIPTREPPPGSDGASICLEPEKLNATAAEWASEYSHKLSSFRITAPVGTIVEGIPIDHPLDLVPPGAVATQLRSWISEAGFFHKLSTTIEVPSKGQKFETVMRCLPLDETKRVERETIYTEAAQYGWMLRPESPIHQVISVTLEEAMLSDGTFVPVLINMSFGANGQGGSVIDWPDPNFDHNETLKVVHYRLRSGTTRRLTFTPPAGYRFVGFWGQAHHQEDRIGALGVVWGRRS